MIAIILAAGMGTRMLPLTESTHKCLLELNNQSLIQNQLKSLAAEKITRVIVVGGYKIDMIKEHLKDEVEYIFNPFYETTNSIVSLWLALQHIDDDIVILNSDVIVDNELIHKMSVYESPINIAVSKEWDETRGYKVATSGDYVTFMSMDIPPENVFGEYAGIISVKKDILDIIRKKTENLMIRKEFNIWFEDMITEVIQAGTRAEYTCVDPDKWYEIDTVEELEYARKKFK